MQVAESRVGATEDFEAAGRRQRRGFELGKGIGPSPLPQPTSIDSTNPTPHALVARCRRHARKERYPRSWAARPASGFRRARCDLRGRAATGIVTHSTDFACTSPARCPARLSADRGHRTAHLVAVKTPAPPLIDGRLQDPVWQLAPGTSAFTQSFPFDGGRPSEKTVLRVLYDESAIYLGFECEQVRTPIVERLTRRDRDSESEWVYVHIDSRNDGKSAYMFAVNIAGVLADAQIIDQTTYSWEWDENWEAKTARTKKGWSAEIRIPLRVLRFDSKLPVQSWGLQASRFIAQRQETDLWTYVPRDVAAPIAFYGRLDGLSDLRGAGALELQPFVLASGQRRDASQIAIGSGTTGTASAGLDLKWHIAQDLTFDVALNPDFSQVELDQIILNLGTYETFLPEKRPFFLEGIDAFSFPMQVFYSRRIGSAPVAPSLRSDASSNEELVNLTTPATIYGAGKLVGRLSPNWTIGALSASPPPTTSPFTTTSRARRPTGWRLPSPRSTSCASNASSAAAATSESSAPARRRSRATLASRR